LITRQSLTDVVPPVAEYDVVEAEPDVTGVKSHGLPHVIASITEKMKPTMWLPGSATVGVAVEDDTARNQRTFVATTFEPCDLGLLVMCAQPDGAVTPADSWFSITM
jgi:hypothetical protein